MKKEINCSVVAGHSSSQQTLISSIRTVLALAKIRATRNNKHDKNETHVVQKGKNGDVMSTSHLMMWFEKVAVDCGIEDVRAIGSGDSRTDACC
jgi:hypothetical protein